jgi:hypothetical protein
MAKILEKSQGKTVARDQAREWYSNLFCAIEIFLARSYGIEIFLP